MEHTASDFLGSFVSVMISNTMRVDRIQETDRHNEDRLRLAQQLEEQRTKIQPEIARLEKYQKTQRVYEQQEIQKQLENFYKGKGPIDFFI